MITTRSYYKGDIMIANANDNAPTSNLLGNAKVLDLDIARYEREVLTKCFGISFYNAFKAQFDINETTGIWTLKSGADAKWEELLNGKEYTYNDKDCVWRGIVYSDAGETPNTSFLAYYVYSKFVQQDEINHTGVGFVKDQAKNATIQTGRSKWAYAYNRFVDLVQGCGIEKSLYDFIRESNELNKDTYPDWKGETFEYVNRFGL